MHLKENKIFHEWNNNISIVKLYVSYSLLRIEIPYFWIFWCITYFFNLQYFFFFNFQIEDCGRVDITIMFWLSVLKLKSMQKKKKNFSFLMPFDKHCKKFSVQLLRSYVGKKKEEGKAKAKSRNYEIQFLRRRLIYAIVRHPTPMF